MSWSADAQQDCAVNATGVAVVFLWMKFCQAQFTRRLRSQINLRVEDRPSIRGALRMFLQQAVIQPSKLFVLPIALVVTIPFGWLLAFYENVTAFGEAKDLTTLWTKSWSQARLWPRQNHLAIAIFILLFVTMSLNMVLIVIGLPHLIKMFTGLENVFTRSGMHSMNSTSLAVIGLLTYACCDPLLKAIYVLRCFHGESLHSGEDLRVELRRLKQLVRVVAVGFLILTSGARSSLGAPPEQPAVQSVNASELDRSIGDTIIQPEFRWRMPREEVDQKKDTEKENAFDRWVGRFFRKLEKWWTAFWKWFDNLMPHPSAPETENDGLVRKWSRGALEIMLIVLCGGLLVIVGLRAREYFRHRLKAAAVTPKTPEPIDLAREEVTADQLPEDEWLRLAGELIQKGDWRLALRALFLAGLVHLSMREMIALARHKSNRDYQKELRRRAPAQLEVQQAFGDNLRSVERAWYGEHHVSQEILADFQSNLERIRAV